MEEKHFFDLVNGLYVKKDATLILQHDQNNKSHKKIVIEDHYVMIVEPGEFYLTHFAAENGKGQTIALQVYGAIQQTELITKLAVVGCDGTASMTGHKSGFIRCLEVLLKRPLQWSICLLHCNELPLRHVFKFLDGSSTGPNTFDGPIGKQLDQCVTDWPVVN